MKKYNDSFWIVKGLDGKESFKLDRRYANRVFPGRVRHVWEKRDQFLSFLKAIRAPYDNLDEMSLKRLERILRKIAPDGTTFGPRVDDNANFGFLPDTPTEDTPLVLTEEVPGYC